VPEMPERPFVPRRTPTRAQPAFGSADFSLSKPFVPGSEQERVDTMRVRMEAEASTVSDQAIQPIENFLDFVAAPAATGPGEEVETFLGSRAEDDELPPVEHFIDPLPAVADFAAENGGDEDIAAYSTNAAADAAQTEWLETDWQQYDWRAIASLADSGEKEASSAWAETDWDARLPRTSETKPTAAQAIATALDQIAQKIRDGELALPGPGTVTDPRTIATTLASLLGIRQ